MESVDFLDGVFRKANTLNIFVFRDRLDGFISIYFSSKWDFGLAVPVLLKIIDK